MTAPGGPRFDKGDVTAWQNFKYDVSDFLHYWGFEIAIVLALVVVLLISSQQ